MRNSLDALYVYLPVICSNRVPFGETGHLHPLFFLWHVSFLSHDTNILRPSWCRAVILISWNDDLILNSWRSSCKSTVCLFQAKVSTGIDPELQFIYFEGIYLLVLNSRWVLQLKPAPELNKNQQQPDSDKVLLKLHPSTSAPLRSGCVWVCVCVCSLYNHPLPS